MPILEITQEMIGEHRSKLTLNYISSVMLWPTEKDESQRQQFMRTSGASFLKAQIKANPSFRRSVSDTDLVSILDDLENTLPPWFHENLTPEAMHHGVMCGIVVHKAILAKEKEKTTQTLGRIKADAASKYEKISTWKYSSGKSTVENIWRDYKSVSHLWASFLLLWRMRGETMPLPCSVEDINLFLTMAERIRLIAESLHPFQSPNPTLLAPGEQWEVPAGLIDIHQVRFPDFPKLDALVNCSR